VVYMKVRSAGRQPPGTAPRAKILFDYFFVLPDRNQNEIANFCLFRTPFWTKIMTKGKHLLFWPRPV